MKKDTERIEIHVTEYNNTLLLYIIMAILGEGILKIVRKNNDFVAGIKRKTVGPSGKEMADN
ncbi:hypothetical protein QTU96_002559 [Enterobacter asburiae]|nr:hypothetical protein [Enterobacter asburiae]